MSHERSIRTLLVIVVILLLVDLGRLFIQTPVAAAPVAVQYTIMDLPLTHQFVSGARIDVSQVKEMENEFARLNDLGRQGWGVVASFGSAVILKK
jgi:hypothetical protein